MPDPRDRCRDGSGAADDSHDDGDCAFGVSLSAPRDDLDTSAFLAIPGTPDAARNFASSSTIGMLWPPDLRLRTDASVFERQARINTILALPRYTIRHLQALLGDDRPDPLLVKALFWRHAFDVDRVHGLVENNPRLTGDDVAEYRGGVEMMAGRFEAAAEWLGRVSAARAPRRSIA